MFLLLRCHDAHPLPEGRHPMNIMIPILAVVLIVALLVRWHEAPYRKAWRNKRKLRQSVLNWKDRR